MSTVFVIARTRRDFSKEVDRIMDGPDYKGERFAYVAGPYSLYGVNLTPERLLFIDGWANRPDAAELVKVIGRRTGAIPALMLS